MLKWVVGFKYVECGGHANTHSHTITVFLIYFSISVLFFSRPLCSKRKARGLVRLSDNAATCHQGHSRWIITLSQGLKLQRRKYKPPLCPPSRSQATEGIRTQAPLAEELDWRPLCKEEELVGDEWKEEKYRKPTEKRICGRRRKHNCTRVEEEEDESFNEALKSALPRTLYSADSWH